MLDLVEVFDHVVHGWLENALGDFNSLIRPDESLGTCPESWLFGILNCGVSHVAFNLD